LTNPTKSELRQKLRTARREHVAAQSDAIRALLFHRPPSPVVDQVGPDAVIALYSAQAHEAPASGYARFFHERGNTLALPHFTARGSAMTFRRHADPLGATDLETGPFGIAQPGEQADEVIPDIIFVPLVGFTASGHRLGQGGGHYDRWLAAHSNRTAIGLAWDVQLCDALPIEPHDIALDAVVTPTRLYGEL
jgi:5-formyltetrahydrofolate cyclo-ligase